MPAMAHRLWKRQGGSTFGNDDGGDDASDYDYGYGDDDYGSWWWSPAGMAVRYAIVALLFAAVLLFFVGGYYHARRRIRKGLQPLPYHRWMVRRFMRQPQPAYQQYHPYNAPQAYQMENYAPPPPAYNREEAPPPVYQPPEGGSKVMADQSYVHEQPLPRIPGEGSGR